MSFSYLENRSNPEITTIEQQSIKTTSESQYKVGKISWKDNALYTDSQLNERLGINPEDEYNIDHLNQRLWGLDAVSSADALSSLYLDNGYLFFNAEAIENPKDDGFFDLTITIFEGVQAYIRHITFEGIGSVPVEDVLKEIPINEGDLFSKTKLINSVFAIAEMGYFDPENIAPNLTPVQDPSTGEYTLVDIEFKLTEIQ